MSIIPDDFDSWWSVESERDCMGDLDVTDENNVSWGSCWQRFWCGTMNLCGCGTDEPKRVMARVLWALIVSWNEREAKRGAENGDRIVVGFGLSGRMPRDVYGNGWDDPIVELCLHVLDSRDLIEHGGSVGGSWLTIRGVEEARDVFEQRDRTVTKDPT